MAEAVKPRKKKKKARLERKVEEPISAPSLARVNAELLFDKSSTNEEEKSVDVVKDSVAEKLPSEVGPFESSQGQCQSNIIQTEDEKSAVNKMGGDLGENLTEDKAKEPDASSDLEMERDTAENTTSVVNSLEPHKEEESHGNLLTQEECAENRESEAIQGIEIIANIDYSMEQLSDIGTISEGSQILNMTVDDSNAEVDEVMLVERTTSSHSEELEIKIDGSSSQEIAQEDLCKDQQTELVSVSEVSVTECNDVDSNLPQTSSHDALLSDLGSKIIVDNEEVRVKSESPLVQTQEMDSRYMESRVTEELPDVSSSTSNVESALPVVNISQELMSPFTEEQLRTFYFNQELSEVPVFVDQFLQNINRETHEFYDLLNTYYKCRISLVKVIGQIETSKREVASCRKQVWTTHNLSVTGKGQCKDKCVLQEEIKYSKAEFNEGSASTLRRLLHELRDHIHEEFQLKSYNCQLARIRVECFIHEMLKSSSLLGYASSDSPLSAKLPRDLRQDDVMGLHALQDAITILFSFKRLGAVEEQFCKDVDSWLSTLVSILQRAGALPDYFFILNHVLRCPPGSIEGLSSNIQFPNFHSIPCESVWNSPLVHHFVVMLATIALPVKERAKLLMRFKHEMKPSLERTISWTLIDENREEDENPEDSWYLLLENDLVALFDQFPFESLFLYLLKVESVEGTPCYSATLSTSNDVVHLLAFSSCIVQILGQIFDTYNLLRYRQFVKRISRTIRWVVQVVSDHWCAYRSWRMEICGESDKDTPMFLTVSTQFNIERLQLEFDQFFSKATGQILNSQSVGALQFLASMPYDAISTNAAWSLLNRLISTSSDSNSDQDRSTKLAHIIAAVPSMEEMIFLFTALSNMAISRSKDDREFINCVTVDLLEFTYSVDDESPSCSRECRDLIAAISSTHPFVMSVLLARIAKLKEERLEGCLYLLKSLPLDLWTPEAEDLEQLRNWLLGHPLHSIQHKVARVIISHMNFDAKQDTGVLFLPRKFHFTIAVMLVEVYGSCVPDGPGGLKKLEYENGGFLSQVSSFAVQSLNKLLNLQAEEEFLRWCWDVMLSLKLHSNDVECDESNEEDSSVLLSIEESQQQGYGSWSSAVLSAFDKFDPEKAEVDLCTELLNVKRALSTHGALACYVALMMTRMGHSPEMLRTDGIAILTKILESGWADAVLRVTSNIFPLFVKCPDIPEKNSKFLHIIDTLVHLDASKAGYSEKILSNPEPGLFSQMLASIITTTVTSAGKRSAEMAKYMISCWFKMLIQKVNWYSDYSVLYLIDQLCKVTYMVEGNFQTIVDHLLEQYLTVINTQSNRGLFSSMMSWFSPGSPITFLEIKKQPEFAYFAYVVLLMEKRYEEKLGIWQKMTSKMVVKPNLQVEAAYKKAASRTKALYVPAIQYLNIYRWAEQGLSTSTDHPMLPLIWHQFFILYLQKQNTAEGLPSRIGVGYRFLDTSVQPGLAKKIRNYLNSAASYHKQKGLVNKDNEADESSSASVMKTHIHDETVHTNLANLFQAMSLWIEESRLHDPNLFLDALPEVYKPDELTKIFQGDQEAWLQYVDKKCMEREMESLGSLWIMAQNKSWRTKHVSREDNQQTKPTATQRIIKRLNRESKPKSLPLLGVTDSPIPEVSLQLLLTRPRLIQDLNDDLERMILFAKTSCVNVDEHTALDGEYLELLQDLYINVPKQVVRHILCNRGKQPCTGAATIILRYEEKEVKDRTERRLGENRNTYAVNTKSFVQPLPHSLCTGAVYVENVISKLMKSVPYANAAQKTDLESAGVQLFYLFAELINGDVKRNSPAIQFFSSGTEVLGKEFIACNESEQERLVKTILAEEASVSFLAPHFNPSPHFRSFLHLYSTTTSLFSETRLTALFVLVSKFDVRTWLSLNPPLSETMFLVRTVIEVMEKFGKQPSDDVNMLFGLFRSHLDLVLRHRFPEQFNQVLTLLMESCRKELLPFVCLHDFLTTIGCQPNDQCQSPAAVPCMVGINEAFQAIAWLSGFFSELHKAFYYSNSKLYTAWKVYIPYIARLLPFLFSKLLEPHSTDDTSLNFDKDRYISKLWNDIFTIYRPWIVPHRADSSWPNLYVEDSLLLIQSFTESSRLAASASIADNVFSFGLNMIWAFYCLEIAPCLLQENTLEIYHGLFMTLAWASFCPYMQDLNYMLELYVTNSPAFHFLGTIVCMLDWPSIIAQQKKYGTGDRFKEYLIGVLRIFVMLSTNKPFMAKTLTQFRQLLECASTFPWYFVDLQNISSVSCWYAENCDPGCIFEDDSEELTVLHLIKSICYMVKRGTNSTDETADDVFHKQNTYVGVVVTIVTRAISKRQVSLKKLDLVFGKLLSDIDHIANISSDQQFIELYSSVLALLNSAAEGPMLQCIECRIEKFLSEASSVSAVLCILSAACRVLAGLDQLLTLSEAAIECFFNRISDMDFDESWTRILEVFLVPELNQDQFIRKALSRQCLLTLYAFNLHRISLCRDSTEELPILKETFLWCTQSVPSSNLCEKYLMMWWQILESVKRQISTHPRQSKPSTVTSQVRQQLIKFAGYCQQIGEDKTYSGILGAMGVGKKSQFPVKFRLVARSLHAFIMAQLPNAGSKLRSFPDAPGAVKAKKSEFPNPEAQTALQEVSNLKKNKHYSQSRDDITWVCDFISNPKKCILDGSELLAYFCKQYYFKVSYIAATARIEGASATA